MAPYLNSPSTQDAQPFSPSQGDQTLSLPRILCLHGGGTNAEIFAQQLRAIRARLATSFRLVFADGPHYCSAGPGVSPVYEDQGPFRRWLRWKVDEHPEIDDGSAADEILYCVRGAMDADAGVGPWVGLLGFSQGGKVAASLLYDTQQRLARTGADEFGWSFAVVMQARHPLVALSEYGGHPALVNAGGVSEGFDYAGVLEDKLRLPTVHVHGLRDPSIHLHRRLMDQYCDARSVSLVEWDGGHRLPLKTDDVAMVCDAILKVAQSRDLFQLS